MDRFKYLVLAAVVTIFFIMNATKIAAQVRVGVNVGVAPDCPYGYYDAAPYGCAPYGYYGPEWFTGGWKTLTTTVANDPNVSVAKYLLAIA